MTRFILNRTDDRATMPKKKILLLAVVWYIALLALNAAICLVVVKVYSSMGIDPSQLTQFKGDVRTRTGQPLGLNVLLLLIIAPVAEEIMFRLGITLKRQAVALWAGLLPVTIAAYLHDCYNNWMVMAATIIIGGALYWAVMRFTTDEQWTRWRTRYLRLAMWLSAILFGLIHLRAFNVITWGLLPYCLAICLRPAFLGAVISYVRVNLGFWWGVLFHIANNVPGVLFLLAISGQ